MYEISNIQDDIYFKNEYAKLYLDNDYELFEYEFAEGEQWITFKSIKKPIASVAGVDIQEELYDIETPYGYGGPITNSTDRKFLVKAFNYYKAHCASNKIVCEFIRLHPFNSINKHSFLFDIFIHERDVVVVDLTQNQDERRAQYSKTTRNIIRKAEKKLKIIENSQRLAQFIETYYDTMKKNKADDFYFFSEDYFHRLNSINEVDLLEVSLEDQLLSIGFIMRGSELAHYHLSANNYELAKENGNYLLLDAAFNLAKSKGSKYMILGGGRTSSPEDNLLKFKKKFSKITMPFYIAGIDFMPEKKAMLNSIWVDKNKNQEIPKIFQLYRV